MYMKDLCKPTILVIEGDKKQEYLYHYLIEKKCNVILSDINSSIHADIVVGSTPLGCNDFCLPVKHHIKLFVAGKIPKKTFDFFIQKNIKVFDILKTEYFIQKNCMYTAEGLLSYMISNTPFSLYNTKILVMGYGNCGKYIVKLLESFTPNITIIEPVCSKTYNICSKYTCLPDISKLTLVKFDIVINTVASNILNNYTHIFSKDTYFFDIASPPYGINNSLNSNILHSHRVSKIPLKYMPKSSALLIGEILLNYISSTYKVLK